VKAGVALAALPFYWLAAISKSKSFLFPRTKSRPPEDSSAHNKEASEANNFWDVREPESSPDSNGQYQGDYLKNAVDLSGY
jgi:hypothetical protein